MPNWISYILKDILPTLTVVVVTSILTVRLALRRFYKEKWWEKKHETYTHLLETIYHLKNYAAQHYEDQISPDCMTEEKRQELTRDMNKFHREFAKLRDLASFHLSDEAVAILDEYQKKTTEPSNSKTLFEWIDRDLCAASQCLQALKEAAKRDLKMK